MARPPGCFASSAHECCQFFTEVDCLMLIESILNPISVISTGIRVYYSSKILRDNTILFSFLFAKCVLVAKSQSRSEASIIDYVCSTVLYVHLSCCFDNDMWKCGRCNMSWPSL